MVTLPTMIRDALLLPPELAALEDEEPDEPLATSEHSLTIDCFVVPLYTRLRGPNCFVASELRVYPDAEAVLRQEVRVPDLMVVLGVADRLRPRYVVEAEGPRGHPAPDLVAEVLSRHSVENRDLTQKRDWYRALGVQEYIVVDPMGQFKPEPRLQGWRFRDARGQALRVDQRVLAGRDGVLRNVVIPYGWVADGSWVRLVDLRTGERLPLFWELEGRLLQEVRARQEAQAQAEIAQEQAEAARQQAAAAEAQARSEAEAREAAEERAAALQAETERLQKELEGRP